MEEIIRKLLKEKGLKMADLALRVGMTQSVHKEESKTEYAWRYMRGFGNRIVRFVCIWLLWQSWGDYGSKRADIRHRQAEEVRGSDSRL